MDPTPLHGPPAPIPEVPGLVLHTLLGFGRHGEVWSADDLTTGRPMAVKIGRRAATIESALLPGADPLHPPADPVGTRPAPPGDREIALLGRLSHPHLVRMDRAVPLPDGELALVLELASGGSLASLVAARGPLEPGEVTTLLVPLAQALGYLHERGLTHGDLAPGNVLFSSDGRPMLGDLGGARVLGLRAESIWGTEGFLDPAAALGADPRAVDVRGLGAVAWFALTGAAPEVDVAARSRPPAAVAAPALSGLLVQCLSADPGQRPDCSEVAEWAWRAAPPLPVRLVPTGPVAGRGLSGAVTRRIRSDRDDSDRSDDDHGAGAGERTGFRRRGRSDRDPGELPAGGPDHRPGVGRPVRRLPPSEQGPRGRRSDASRRRRSPRGRLLGLVVVALVAVTVLIVVAVGAVSTVGNATATEGRGRNRTSENVATAGRPGPASGAPAVAPDSGRPTASEGAAPRTRTVQGSGSPSGDDATSAAAALTRIARARARAFGSVRTGPLRDADVPGSPAWRSDAALVRRLRAGGFRLVGVGYRITDVRILERSRGRMRVSAAVTTSAHRQVSSGAVAAVPADGPRLLRVVLVRAAGSTSGRAGPGGWRVHDVTDGSIR